MPEVNWRDAQLAEAGIDSFIVADNAGGTFPMMQMVTGGYKVMVLTAVADEATEILTPDQANVARGDSGPAGLLDPLRGFTSMQLTALAILVLLLLVPLTAYAVRVWIF